MSATANDTRDPSGNGISTRLGGWPPANQVTAGLGQVYVQNITASSFQFSTTVTPASNTVYSWSYIVIQ